MEGSPWHSTTTTSRPTTWLTDQAVSYSSRAPGEGTRVFDDPHPDVAKDLRVLFQYPSITRSHQVRPIIEKSFPGTPIPERSRALDDHSSAVSKNLS